MDFTNSIIDNTSSVHFRNRESIKNAIAKLLDSKPEIIVINGYCRNEIPYFKELCQYSNTIMLDWLLGDYTFEGNGVWFSYEEAGYMAGKYLLEQGCKNPIFFPNYIRLEHRLNFDIYTNHKERKLADGFRKAMQEGGVNPETSVVECFVSSLKEHNQLLDRLSMLDIYDGFCSADVNVVSLMKNLLENRGSIPEYMQFIGLYNTPWSSHDSFFPFTSIDFNTAAVTDAVLETVELPPEKRKNIYVLENNFRPIFLFNYRASSLEFF